jgi:hypothetical protein
MRTCVAGRELAGSPWGRVAGGSLPRVTSVAPYVPGAIGTHLLIEDLQEPLIAASTMTCTPPSGRADAEVLDGVSAAHEHRVVRVTASRIWKWMALPSDPPVCHNTHASRSIHRGGDPRENAPTV